MSSTHTSARSGAPVHSHRTIHAAPADQAATVTASAAQSATASEAAVITAQKGQPVLAWRQADEDVFVATNAGEFAGFVTVDCDVHVVHDNHSRRIGSFPTLAAARQALVDATRPPSRGRERLRHRILARRR